MREMCGELQQFPLFNFISISRIFQAVYSSLFVHGAHCRECHKKLLASWVVFPLFAVLMRFWVLQTRSAVDSSQVITSLIIEHLNLPHNHLSAFLVGRSHRPCVHTLLIGPSLSRFPRAVWVRTHACGLLHRQRVHFSDFPIGLMMMLMSVVV